MRLSQSIHLLARLLLREGLSLLLCLLVRPGMPLPGVYDLETCAMRIIMSWGRH